MANVSGRQQVKTRKWQIDLSGRSKGDRQIANPDTSSLASPQGFTDRMLPHDIAKTDDSGDLVVKKSWDIALGPIKQVPMNLFIMWMAGSSISIFPIMMVGMMVFRPIQALIAMQQTFKMIEGSQALLQKFVWLLGNLIIFVLALYKCHTMGLLPTHPSDWLSFVEAQQRLEWSGGGVTL